MKITTNNVPRDVIQAYELSHAERKEFDYLDWRAIEESASNEQFFRYKGELYDLGEFEAINNQNAYDLFKDWDGVQSDTYFSGMLVRYVNDQEQVIVGRYST